MSNDNHALDQAKTQLSSMQDMLDHMRNAESDREHDDALQAIFEDPLEVKKVQTVEVLLCTGGPAVRIVATVGDSYFENIRIQYQDWGTPWTTYETTGPEQSALEDYLHYLILDPECL